MSIRNHEPSASAAAPVAAESKHQSFLGTGLPGAHFTLLVALSSGLFFLWPDPIWSASQTDSHVARFAVSYAIVVPVAAMLLWVAKTFTSTRWITATFVAWGMKLVITAVTYSLVASGGGMTQGERQAHSAPIVRTAATSAVLTKVTGRVMPKPIVPTFAFVVGVEATAETDSSRTASQVITGGKFERTSSTVSIADRLVLSNRDSVFYSVKVIRVGSVGRDVVANAPLPPNTKEREVELPGPGLFRLTSEAGGKQLSTYILVSHPEHTVLLKSDHFSLLVDVNQKPTIAVVAMPEAGTPQWTTKQLDKSPTAPVLFTLKPLP